LDNGIGGFTADGREYQIFLENYPKLTQRPGQITPAPWANVIANPEFGFLVTESGGGYTWSMNSGENRLTPWTNDPLSDPSGEASTCVMKLMAKSGPPPHSRQEKALIIWSSTVRVIRSLNRLIMVSISS
jgi:cellobiose phosphorylase